MVARLVLIGLLSLTGLPVPYLAWTHIDAAHASTADNPLVESFVLDGNLDAATAGLGLFVGFPETTTATILTVNLPPGSTIEKAFLYFGETEIDDLPTNSATASLNAISLGTVVPASVDVFDSGPVLTATYVWDATAAVAEGANNVSITTSAAAEHQSHLLLVIFSNPAFPFRRVIVHDGVELIGATTAETSFLGLMEGTARLLVAVFGGDTGEDGEEIRFNGNVVACCSVWDQSSGPHFDIESVAVTTTSGTNTAAIATRDDVVVWQLAALVVTPLQCGNGIVQPPEQCDPPGSSCTGAFVGTCEADCTCPGMSSTTSTATSTTITVTTSSSTATTTSSSATSTTNISNTTTTTVPPADHYTCYNSSTKEPNPPDVTLVDQFETATFHPKRCRPKSFCTPSGKNGSQINDAGTHLKGYKIRRIGAAEPRVTIDVTDQFGTVRLATKRADRLLVPSAKSLTAPPGPPDPLAAGNQHYKCYRVTGASFAPHTVTVADQFGTKQLELRKIESLCTPVSKNGSDIKDPARHLLCYSVRPATTPPSPVFVTNQFGSQTVNLSREGAFCVPATKTIIP